MARLQTRDENALQQDTLDLLNPTRINDKIADVYLQFANSEHALHAYMKMEESLRKSPLSELEVEAIKLLVSEITQCDFCLATHTMKSRKAGLQKEQQIAVRSGTETGVARLDTIVKIVKHFFNHKGPLDDALIAEARAQQLTDEALIDIAMAVSTIFFTNITNHINHTESSLPAPPKLS